MFESIVRSYEALCSGDGLAWTILGLAVVSGLLLWLSGDSTDRA